MVSPTISQIHPLLSSDMLAQSQTHHLACIYFVSFFFGLSTHSGPLEIALIFVAEGDL